MRIWRYIFLLSIFAALPLFSQQAGVQVRVVGPDDIIALSGLREMIESTARLSAAGMKKYSGRLTETAAEKYSKTIDSSYGKEKIFSVFKKSFTGKIKAQDVPEIEKWLSSPLGMKITEIEKKSLTPEGAKGFEEFVPKALSLGEKRKELVREFLKETSSEEMSAKIICEPLRAMMKSLRDSLPEDMRVPETAFMGDIDALEQDALARYRALLPVSVAFTYRDLSDEEFSRMLDFYGTSAGKNFNSAVLEALVSSLYSAGEECGKGMAEILIDAASKSPNRRNGEPEKR